MKLRNKKTGEIIQLNVKCENGGELRTFDLNTNTDKPITLTELNEEWEDYEEPKKHYSITQFGDVVDEVDGYMSETIDEMKEVGNYFSSREEAEKAVEKLKAWKRLKDKGFRFIDHIDRDTGQGMTRYEWNGYINGEDLDLLFSQEDD